MATFHSDSANTAANRRRANTNTKFFSDGEKVLAYYGPHLYEAKVLKSEIQKNEWKYFLHYIGWCKCWDEWVGAERLMKTTDGYIRKQQALDKKQGVEPKSGPTNQTETKTSNDSKVDKDNEKSSGAKGKKRKHESGDEQLELKLDKSIELYRDCLGIDTTLKILCDSTYISYVSSFQESDYCKIFTDLRDKFGVKYIRICTTRCVYAAMRTSKGSDDYVVNYALNTPWECQHSEDLPPKTCIEGVMKQAVLEPYFLASLDQRFCQYMRSVVPILLDKKGRLTFRRLEKSEKKMLQKIKKKRLIELERVKKVSLEKEAEMKLWELEEKKLSAALGGSYSSKRERVKKKRNRKKKNKSAVVNFYKRVLPNVLQEAKAEREMSAVEKKRKRKRNQEKL